MVRALLQGRNHAFKTLHHLFKLKSMMPGLRSGMWHFHIVAATTKPLFQGPSINLHRPTSRTAFGKQSGNQCCHNIITPHIVLLRPSIATCSFLHHFISGEVNHLCRVVTAVSALSLEAGLQQGQQQASSNSNRQSATLF
jgi:hypothetical protein